MNALATAVTVHPHQKLEQWGWTVLIYNILVVLWGAFVRATGSGAGCGAHWPLCNGQMLPVAPQIHTIIEFTHRMTSGLALVSVVATYLWMRRIFEHSHPARRAAFFALVFMVNETMVGALLVLLGLVAGNRSPWRALVLAIHLVNTLLLLGSLALTAWWSGHPAPRVWAPPKNLRRLVLVGLGAMIVVSAAGGIAALGDTLFPSTSITAGVQQEFSTGAPLLVRLRVLHPILAILTGGYLLWLISYSTGRVNNQTVERWGYGTGFLILAQFVLGAMNIMLLTPVWSQLTHLLLTDLLWVGLVVFSANVLSVPRDSPH